jgi:hypothetical protein
MIGAESEAHRPPLPSSSDFRVDHPLITVDREILERSSRFIETEAPDGWVLRESSG